MKCRKETYQLFQFVNAFFLSVLLLCATLCISFAYTSSEEIAGQLLCDTESQNDDLPQNPFSGPSEEKTENTINSLSEFLPEIFAVNDDFYLCGKLRNRTVDIYMAFHSEMVLPPPKS
jgi:hypothetical protein